MEEVLEVLWSQTGWTRSTGEGEGHEDLSEVLETLGHPLGGIVPIYEGEPFGEGWWRGGRGVLVPEGLEDDRIGRVMHTLRGEVTDSLAKGPVAHETIEGL
jgi:hypothetical protein